MAVVEQKLHELWFPHLVCKTFLTFLRREMTFFAVV